MDLISTFWRLATAGRVEVEPGSTPALCQWPFELDFFTVDIGA